MKIAIIGIGVVGKALAEFFGHRHEVFRVDLDTELTLEDAARVADVVFIVTLPIEGVAALFARAASVMRHGTLLVHGTSIENPIAPHNIDITQAAKKDITVSHTHFQFKPEIPLSRTLFGQTITISTTGRNQKLWRDWLVSEFAPFGPIIEHLEVGEHDDITTISQLGHAIATALFGFLWTHLPSRSAVIKGIHIGGPPFRLLCRAVLRTAAQPKVMCSILLNHPHVLDFITRLKQALGKVEAAIVSKDRETLETMLGKARKILPPKELEVWDESTNQLARRDADMQQTVARFRFPEEKNKTGLLIRVLLEFSNRDINMTSQDAHNTPDGGCAINIGVKENSSAVQEAIRAVNGWA